MTDQDNVPGFVLALPNPDDTDIEPLLGKPFFDVLMRKSYVDLAHLPVPRKFTSLLPAKASVPVTLTRGKRSWELKYVAKYTQKRLGYGWKAFVDDNNLKVGDVCLFELMSCETTLIKLKVQVLRGDLPPVLLEREAAATSTDSPLVIEID